jgi:hypothetical protein
VRVDPVAQIEESILLLVQPLFDRIFSAHVHLLGDPQLRCYADDFWAHHIVSMGRSVTYIWRGG